VGGCFAREAASEFRRCRNSCLITKPRSAYELDRETTNSPRVELDEAIENLPRGWEARATYEILDDNHFRETFELRKPDWDWSCYIATDLRRASEGDRAAGRSVGSSIWCTEAVVEFGVVSPELQDSVKVHKTSRA